MKCNKCGFDNEENAKYCSNCGSELNRSACLVCSNCGTPLRRTDKYCSNCSIKIVTKGDDEYVEGQQDPNTYNSVKEKNFIKQTSDKIALVSIAVIFLSLLLIAIGVFGTSLVAKVVESRYEETSTQGLVYYFKEMYENLDVIETSYPLQGYFEFVKVFSIIDAVIYYLCFIAVFASAGYYGFKIYKYRKHGEMLTFKIFNIMSAFLIFHLGFGMLLNFSEITSIGVRANVSFGWGSILIIVGISLGLISQLGLIGYKSYADRRFNVQSIIGITNLILLFIISIVTFGPIIKISETGIVGNVSSFESVVACLQAFSSEKIENTPEGFDIAFAGAMLLVLAFVLYIASFVIVCMTKNKLSLLITLGIGFVAGIIGGILSFNGANTIYYPSYNVALGCGVVLFIIFSILLLCVNILPILLSKKK